MHKPTARDLETRPFWPRNPIPVMPKPLSNPTYEPARVIPNMEEGTDWSPYGTREKVPYFGGYDGLDGRLMHVPQADTYDSSPNPWPANGQFDRPNSMGLAGVLLRLKPDTSAHPGFSMNTGRGDPTSLFNAPPVFSMQTVPVPAVGL